MHNRIRVILSKRTIRKKEKYSIKRKRVVCANEVKGIVANYYIKQVKIVPIFFSIEKKTCLISNLYKIVHRVT